VLQTLFRINSIVKKHNPEKQLLEAMKKINVPRNINIRFNWFCSKLRFCF